MAPEPLASPTPRPEGGPRKSSKKKNSYKMWTKTVMAAGFTFLPSVLLFKQDKLKLSPAEMNVLLHLIASWWQHNKFPHLSKKTIANRMGVDPRTVQRHLTSLERLGLLKREERHGANKARQTNRYDLRPLADKLYPLAVELKKERAEKKGGGA